MSNLTFLIDLVAADHLSDAVIRIRKYYPCSLRRSSCDIRYDLVKQRIWSQLNTFRGVGESSTIPKYNRNAKINYPVVVLEMRKKILSRCGFIDRVLRIINITALFHRKQRESKSLDFEMKPAV